MKAQSPNTTPQSPFAFAPQEALEFMQKMWNPLGVPIPGFGLPGAQQGAPTPAPTMAFPNPATMFATISPEEVDRKITELKVIEGWLTMSLSMMQMSIKTLELQKASLEALRAAQVPAAAAAAAAAASVAGTSSSGSQRRKG